QAEDGIRDGHVTGVQTCALPIFSRACRKVPATSTIPVSLRQNFPRWLRADLPLLAGDSPDEFMDRSGDRIRNRLLVQTNIRHDKIGRASCRERVETAGGYGGVQK